MKRKKGSILYEEIGDNAMERKTTPKVFTVFLLTRNVVFALL